jgi:hypothetical protein
MTAAAMSADRPVGRVMREDDWLIMSTIQEADLSRHGMPSEAKSAFNTAACTILYAC